MKITKKNLIIIMAIVLVMLAGCATASPDPGDTQAEGADAGTNSTSSTNPVTTPDSDEVGESLLERATDKITLNFDACCVSPGNASTAWWLIGDVELPMTSVQTKLAIGFVADSEELDLELILEAVSDGVEDPYDGIRLAVLDH